jgi:uncharacterized membrane protein
MIPRLLNTWDAVRSSLWALPLAMAMGAGLLAYAALSAKLELGNNPAWYFYSGNAQEAPQFLSNLVTAMITMATLAISITMVVLALAAQQLGPRLIRSFMSDRRTQAALGLFISTVVYLMLVLRSTQGNSVPNLAVTVGTALVFLSVGTLLFFVHHLARSIIADSVITRVGAQLDANIERLLPKDRSKRSDSAPGPKKGGAPIPLTVGGYVQGIDFGAVVKAAAKAEAVVTLDIRAGQHAVPGHVFAYVTPKKAAGDDLRCAVQGAMIVGSERTAVQDLEYSIHQLVEVALRALSPGINDPYTAIAAVDRLTLSMRKMMEHALAQQAWYDKDDKLRLVVPVSTFEGMVDAAFNQIRQLSASMPAVLIRMADNLAQLVQQADDDQRPVLQKHLRMVLDAGRRGIEEKSDLKDLTQAGAMEGDSDG